MLDVSCYLRLILSGRRVGSGLYMMQRILRVSDDSFNRKRLANLSLTK